MFLSASPPSVESMAEYKVMSISIGKNDIERDASKRNGVRRGKAVRLFQTSTLAGKLSRVTQQLSADNHY